MFGKLRRFCDIGVSLAIEGFLVLYSVSVSDFVGSVEAYVCLRVTNIFHKYH
jgi:hypothetical protein